MKKKLLLNCIFLLFLIIVACSQVVFAKGDIQATCGNGVFWKYNDGNFTLQNLNLVTDKLNENETPLYVIGVYTESGRLMTYGISLENYDTTKVPCNIDDITKCTVKLFFLSDSLSPLDYAETFEIVNVEPTCDAGGYQSVYTYATGERALYNVVYATGHDFADAVIERDADIVSCGFKKTKCRKCDAIERKSFYMDTGVARLCMYGDLTGIGKKEEVPITVSFEGEGKSLENYALLKYQGHTSLIYDKKNFTLKLFKDEQRTQKNKIVFRDWNKEHKYILKANYVDPSACRNLICANIWAEMVSCREGHSERLDECSNYGATDGFPISLYLNDEFIGLYTMTLHRDDDLFNMEDDVQDAIAVTNSNNYDESKFKAEATFTDNSDWEVEFNGLADDTWVENKVNQLIDFIRTASDEEFKDHLSDYMDVNSAIDYLIAIYSLGITENGSKNMTLASYANGPFMMSLCDMECAFGLYDDGTGYYQPDYFLPFYADGGWDSATNSLLWDRVLNLFHQEVRIRYAQLRAGVITVDGIIDMVEDFISNIPVEFYQADANRYSTMPAITPAPMIQIRDYVEKRLPLLDAIFMN